MPGLVSNFRQSSTSAFPTRTREPSLLQCRCFLQGREETRAEKPCPEEHRAGRPSRARPPLGHGPAGFGQERTKLATAKQQTFQLQNLLPHSTRIPESWTETRIPPRRTNPIMSCWHKDGQMQQDVHSHPPQPRYPARHLRRRRTEPPHHGDARGQPQ